MSEMGDMYRDMREYQQKKRAVNLKTNSEVVLLLAGFLQFEIIQRSESHLSLFHPDGRRLDYWPSTNKATWFEKKRFGKTFVIKDIEQFIMKHFASTDKK